MSTQNYLTVKIFIVKYGTPTATVVLAAAWWTFSSLCKIGKTSGIETSCSLRPLLTWDLTVPLILWIYLLITDHW